MSNLDQEIEDPRDPASYWHNPQKQERYAQLLEARETGAPVPATKANTARIRELETLMADTYSDYWRGPKVKRLQAEYRALISGAEVVNAETFPDEALTVWTESLSATPDEVRAGFERMRPIEAAANVTKRSPGRRNKMRPQNMSGQSGGARGVSERHTTREGGVKEQASLRSETHRCAGKCGRLALRRTVSGNRSSLGINFIFCSPSRR